MASSNSKLNIDTHTLVPSDSAPSLNNPRIPNTVLSFTNTAAEVDAMGCELERSEQQEEEEKKDWKLTRVKLRVMASTFGPNQALPSELLESIFLCCLQQDGHTRMERDCAPLNVSQVCRHWRRVSLEISCLWARLHIVLDDDESVLRKIIPATRLFLLRSRGLNLSIHVESLRNTDRSTGPEDSSQGSVSWELMEPVFAELAEHSDRLKSLTLTISGGCCYKSLQYIDARFPELQELSIRTYDRENHFWNFGYLFDHLALKIRTLHYEPTGTTALSQDNLRISKTLKKLIFAVQPDYMTVFHRILDVYPSLEELHLKPTSPRLRHLGRWRVHPHHIKRVRIFSSVRTLEITVLQTFEDLVCTYLDTTRFSNLHCLTLHFADDVLKKREIMHHLVDFITVSNAPIEEFNLIHSRGDDEEETILILSLLKGLKKLHIGASNAVMGHLELSTRNDARSSPLLCPSLEEIILDVRNVTAQSTEIIAVQDMILSRVSDDQSGASSDPPMCLRKVGVLCEREEEKIWMTVIKKIQTRDLVVEIYHSL